MVWRVTTRAAWSREAYERFGFAATSAPMIEHGIRFIPMRRDAVAGR